MTLKTSNIKPLHDYVLVDPVDDENKSVGGIYLPETAKEKPTIGVVVAVGPGRTDKNGKIIKISIKAGAKVYYKKWGGSEVKVGNKELLLVEEKDILAIVK
jgi:chaperonin GroES